MSAPRRVDDLAEQRSLAERDDFLSEFKGGVLLRLDERGGKGEAASWAFSKNPKSVAVPPREDEQVDAEALREALTDDTRPMKIVASEEESDLGPPPPAFMIDDNVNFPPAGVGPDDDTLTAAPHVTRSFPMPPARGSASVYTLPSEPQTISVGRGPEAQVLIAERSVSKLHALLHRKSRGFDVEDKGSANGTKINNRKVGKRTAYMGSADVLSLGDVELVYLDAEMLWEKLPEIVD